ncbi:MAG TPA: hypothetical protein VND90_05340 [Terracidiphilus sp.]|nr:hypothetical protein [Terracidiphilus sp.]
MKKHAVGLAGILIAVGVAVWLAATKTITPARTTTQLDLALAVVLLGMVAAVRGSLFWILLSAVGLVEVLFVIF